MSVVVAASFVTVAAAGIGLSGPTMSSIQGPRHPPQLTRAKDIKMAQRLVFQRLDKKWAWHLEADNGEIIATDGSQGYENEADAKTMSDRVINGEFASADRRRRPLPKN